MPREADADDQRQASDSTPTLIVVVQLSVTASTSAATEIHARLIAPSLLGRRGQRAHERRDVGELLEPVDELEHFVDAGLRQHERCAVAPLLVAARRA